MSRTLAYFPAFLRPLFLVSAAAAQGGVAPASADAALDPRVARAKPQAGPYFFLLAQLGLLLLTISVYRLEEPVFVWVAALIFAGFAVHYWLPFRFKEPFWIALSVVGAFAFFGLFIASLLLATGLVLFGILWLPLQFRWRLALLTGAFAVLMLLRAQHGLPIPSRFWAVFGALFMFRIIVYLYDQSHEKKKPSLQEFLSYFYLLPNFYFLLFPVIDFRTMRRSYFEKDIHEVAQQGIAWMARGAVHLVLYRFVYHLNGRILGDNITTFPSLLATMFLTYLLYLRVSGQFHIIVGMLHLFGYNLPETNRRYLLASSFTDYWRRINIYWKDFMVKVVYFPVYFRLRKGGEARAQVLATAAVFLVTWFLHGYQQFWLSGEFLFRWTDAVFWTALGLLVIFNVLYELKHRSVAAKAAPQPFLLRAVRVAGMLLLITTLWSLWNAASLSEWLDLVTWWKIGI